MQEVPKSVEYREWYTGLGRVQGGNTRGPEARGPKGHPWPLRHQVRTCSTDTPRSPESPYSFAHETPIRPIALRTFHCGTPQSDSPNYLYSLSCVLAFGVACWRSTMYCVQCCMRACVFGPCRQPITISQICTVGVPTEGSDEEQGE
jgi:hypothetical protein